MSSTPNDPQDPRSGAAGQPQPYGQGAVNGAPAGYQYGQAGGKYGTTEYNPNQYTGTMERPSTVDRLLKLTLISLGVYALGAVLGLINFGTTDMSEVLAEQNPNASQMDSDTLQRIGTFGLVGAIIVLVVMVGLYLLVYFNLKNGKNWARILGTVFAALAIVSGLFNLISGNEGMATGFYIAGIVLGIIKIIVDILWIVTAFRAPNTAWFNQNQVQR